MREDLLKDQLMSYARSAAEVAASPAPRRSAAVPAATTGDSWP